MSIRSTTKESIVTLDRRRGDRRDLPVRPSLPAVNNDDSRKVQRRRQIDPTTCEREYTQEECDFMQAMETYKRKSGRMFPTCSEILEVLRGMGYAKVEAQLETALKALPSADAMVTVRS